MDTRFTQRLDPMESPQRFGDDELVLGIDLGTSNSAACVVVNGSPVMIDLRDPDDNRAGVRSIPSVVAFDDQSNSVVGQKAMIALADNPKRTVAGSKRFVGRQYDSPFVQKMLPHFAYKVVPGTHGEVAVDINGRTKSLSAISAYVLSAIHQRAESQLGRSVHKAVITVPAYYNDNQRDAVVQAGRMAGLQVVRILAEPTAAAIAYGLDRQKSGTFLVYDLGGGTFDVSVMQVRDGKLTVLASAGDTFLGGEDFDALIVTSLRERYHRLTGVALSGPNAALKRAVEQAKRRLSARPQVLVSCNVQRSDRTVAKLEMPIERSQIERLVEPLVKRTLDICDDALRAARIDRSKCDDVLMVGGQTLMPFVRDKVAAHFGKQPRHELNPDEAVALGAGLLPTAAVAFSDVLPMTIGIAWDGKFQPVIAKNTAVPYRRRVSLKLAKKDLPGARLDLHQGDSDTLAKTERLGSLALDTLTPGNEDPLPLAVDFALSADCLLSIRLTNTETNESQTILLNTRT